MPDASRRLLAALSPRRSRQDRRAVLIATALVGCAVLAVLPADAQQRRASIPCVAEQSHFRAARTAWDLHGPLEDSIGDEVAAILDDASSRLLACGIIEGTHEPPRGKRTMAAARELASSPVRCVEQTKQLADVLYAGRSLSRSYGDTTEAFVTAMIRFSRCANEAFPSGAPEGALRGDDPRDHPSYQSGERGLVPESQRADAAGIYKSSMFDPDDWQHVATIHGWADDFDVCEEIVEFLERKEPGRYMCRRVKDASGRL